MAVRKFTECTQKHFKNQNTTEYANYKKEESNHLKINNDLSIKHNLLEKLSH